MEPSVEDNLLKRANLGDKPMLYDYLDWDFCLCDYASGRIVSMPCRRLIEENLLLRGRPDGLAFYWAEYLYWPGVCWKGERKAELLREDEEEALKWQRIGNVKKLNGTGLPKNRLRRFCC